MLSKDVRRLVGFCFLATTVFLWVTSSFLASSIFADATFSKPFFVNYVNMMFFMLPLLPHAARSLYARTSSRGEPLLASPSTRRADYEPVQGEDEVLQPPDAFEDAGRDSISQSEAAENMEHEGARRAAPLNTRETFKLSMPFAILWFISTYFNGASLQYTTVASSTILSSTSSVFILIIGSIFRVERFTLRKVIGVVASLAGVTLIALSDSSDDDSTRRGTFPHKSPAEIAVGDAMALFAAFCYGVYGISLVKRVGDESRIHMPLFIGFIGLINTVVMWPGFAILHWLGAERFELPSSSHVWAVVLSNATVSLVSDVCWAYSMLFLSPLVVTVGLSLTIPLSLLGQAALNSTLASPIYLVGAAIVLCSFILVNYESRVDPPLQEER